MGKIKRGNYVFITWKGDHDPKHVHIFKNGREIGKWNLEKGCIMEGRISKKVQKIIDILISEGKL